MTTDPGSSEPIWERSPAGAAGSTLPGAADDVPPALFAHLRSHLEAEQALLDEYAALVDRSPSAALRYLMALLMDDEKHHHHLFRAIAASADAEQEVGGKPVLPGYDLGDVHDREVTRMTEALLAEEKRDAHELRRLLGEMGAVEDSQLWRLLVELMEHDTRKHIAILRFVKRHLGRPGRGD
ncbi:MAG TPA: hypothetical protein VHB02_12000 [Acidimicrobiales bacterium]|nr:hypothetical protein [Acidimicrobiales bacterium]